MEKFIKKMREVQTSAICAWQKFKTCERGDTNFISMLLIIGVVVVLAGLFLTLGTEVMDTVKQKVIGFLNGLG